ncbi:D-xylose transporter XylE [Solimonas sp. K1W22B-7]|uniref:D-xylose transporter XylE n=1 Tax=Solimonas sp. K1W22B-7 TaxID=2303331 RepID=UPI000E331200|nr:D-xylose transporter XylE [Solimonas sp. K1W22B-7]AXQ28576.1 D-xylose transporter XylE [Solimonas sp. K1W22B-7]
MSGNDSGLVTRLTLVATLGGLLFGYDTAVISGAVGAIDAYFIAPQGLGETAANSLAGFTVSSALFGCILGAMISGAVSTRYGRRAALILAAALFLVSSVGSALPELGLGAIGAMGPDALLPFILYRILGGIGIGLASMVSPLYIAEIAPREARGRLVSCNQMAIVIGIVLVYFVNWWIARQGDSAWLHASGWRWMFASAALPAGLFLALLMAVPDTPRSLVFRGREAEAQGLLQRLNGAEEGARTLAEIRDSLVERTQPLLSFGGKVLVVGIMLSVLQQAVGINAVLYYAPTIFQNMGATGDTALLQTVLVGSVNLLATLIAIFTVDRWGRKPLLILGGLQMGLAMAALAVCFQVQALGSTALLAVLVYIAGFALSWGPVTWVLLAEIFPNSIKGKALSIAVAAQWLANLAVTWSFKVLDGNSWLISLFNHGFTYWLYAVVSVLSAVFVARMVPETKGRSLESIEGFWTRRPSAAPAADTAKA